MDSVAGMRVFARVVEAGSLSAAGRQLGVAPSSISRQISDLESELGARLFHRTTRKLSLTEAGRLYFERATRILLAVEEAKLAVSQLGGTPSGILRVSAPASLSRRHVAPALSVFQKQFPAIRIALSVTDRVIDLVGDEADVAIRVGALQDSSLVARRIGSGKRLVCGTPAYLRRAGTPKEPRDLETHNCLTFRSHPGHNLWKFRGSKGTMDVRVSGSLFADDGASLVGAAMAGLGLVLVPTWLVGVELKQGRLREMLPEFKVIPGDSPLYAVYPHQHHLPPKVRVFVDFLVERFAGQTSWDT